MNQQGSKEQDQNLPVVFVTGGAGYIGSHFLEYWAQGTKEYLEPHRIVVLDDLSGGHLSVIQLLNTEAQKNYLSPIVFEKVDLCDFKALKDLFERYRPLAVVHYAGKISVAESVAQPAFYFKNNVEGSENLLLAMKDTGCRKLVFSSTAAVYGAVIDSEPISEESDLDPVNPYGHTKWRTEQSILEACSSWGLQAIIFRYFNAAGAAFSGLIGEWHEPETHLIPLVLESALQPEAELKVYGEDYPTRDGSCVRDYIHVTDLAHAHVLGLRRLLKNESENGEIFNLGTQRGTTVLEVIEAVKKVTKKPIRIVSSGRRAGDSPALVASAKKAERVLGWKAVHSDIETIVKTAYIWHQNHLRISGKI